MFTHDLINDAVLNDIAINGNDSSVVVVGRAHRTSPECHTLGKRLPVAYLTTPAALPPRAETVSASEPRSQERWCRRQRSGMSCCMATGQAPAAIWASLILAQQSSL